MLRLLIALLACAALIAGCGSDDSDEPSAAGGSAASEVGEDGGERAGKASGEEAVEPADGEPAGQSGRGEAGGEAAEEPAGDAEGAPAGEGSPGPASAGAEPRRGPRVTLRDSQFGPVLFDGHRRALYLFTRDPRRKTRCYGACAEAWPPFYAKGRPRAGRGVDRSLLGTIERRDGRRQVTYKGRPLYFYVDDPRGQVLCNDVFEFGGTWYALNAEGDPPA